MDLARRAIRELQAEAAGILTVGAPVGGMDGSNRHAGPKTEEVHKVASLSDNPAAADLRIQEPMIKRECAGVDGGFKMLRARNLPEPLRDVLGQGSEATVEAHHERLAGSRVRFGDLH